MKRWWENNLPWDARGKTGLTGTSLGIVTSLFNAWATAIQKEKDITFSINNEKKTIFYFQLIHDKQNEDIIRRTYVKLQ